MTASDFITTISQRCLPPLACWLTGRWRGKRGHRSKNIGYLPLSLREHSGSSLQLSPPLSLADHPAGLHRTSSTSSHLTHSFIHSTVIICLQVITQETEMNRWKLSCSLEAKTCWPHPPPMPAEVPLLRPSLRTQKTENLWLRADIQPRPSAWHLRPPAASLPAVQPCPTLFWPFSYQLQPSPLLTGSPVHPTAVQLPHHFGFALSLSNSFLSSQSGDHRLTL